MSISISTERELSDFEPIIIEINEVPKILDLKIRKQKGEIKNLILINKDIEKESGELYWQAKKLPPTELLPDPYNNIKFLISPVNMYSKKEGSKIRFNKYDENSKVWIDKMTKKLSKNSIDQIYAYSSITGILNYLSHDLFVKHSNTKKSENALFITSVLHLSSIEEYIVYREKNSVFSYKDNYHLLELPYYIGPEKEPTNEESRKEFLRVFSKVNYNIIPKNICNLENLQLDLNIYLDLVVINVSYFLYRMKKFMSYANSQMMYNLIVYSFQKLKSGGTLMFDYDELDSQLICDIIGILSFYFKKVYIIRSPIRPLLSRYQTIVCENFKGIQYQQLDKLLKISQEWNKLSDKCNIDIKNWEPDKYYVKSILNYKDNYKSITSFVNLNTVKKIKYFNLIISVYNELKICGDETIKKYEDKKISNTIYYLKLNNIDVSISHKKVDKDILKDDFVVNFKKTKWGKKFSSYSKIKNLNISDKEYNLQNLDIIANNLKFTKRILDTLDYQKYKKTTEYTKKFGDKILILKDIIEQKYTRGFRVTQAFLKIYEILETYDLVKTKKDTFNSFHFCEAPGYFILSLNRYIGTKTKIKRHDWVGQTLNTRSEKNQKYKKQKLFDIDPQLRRYIDQWDFGPDGSGDITKTKNIRYYKKYLQEADLATSDCGLDMRDPTKAVYQDKELAYVNFCQILMILNGLKIGGHYVGKVFLPQTSNYVIGLNYLLSQSFKEFYIHKPILNIGSGEVYLVCKNFIGIDQKIINQLFEVKKSLKLETSLVNVPDKFLKEYDEIMSFFVQNQVNYIQKNIYYYENPSTLIDIQKIKEIQKKNSEGWIRYFNFT